MKSVETVGEELLDCVVLVSVCTAEMARPDWVQKAKHLADTCQAAKRMPAATETTAVTLLFQTEKESVT